MPDGRSRFAAIALFAGLSATGCIQGRYAFTEPADALPGDAADATAFDASDVGVDASDASDGGVDVALDRGADAVDAQDVSLDAIDARDADSGADVADVSMPSDATDAVDTLDAVDIVDAVDVIDAPSDVADAADVADVQPDVALDAVDADAVDATTDAIDSTDTVCGTGTHLCAGACVADDDTMACGPMCVDCPTATNGTPVCSLGLCGVQCNPGYERCPAGCVTGFDVTACGPSCTVCPAPSQNGMATCDGTMCGIACASGYHACGTECVSDTNILNCGTSCTACVPPTNSTATCDGTNCGFTCIPGYHVCGVLCVSSTDPATCGSSCAPCLPPANATSTCDGMVCGFTCNSGYVPYMGGCVLAPPQLVAPQSGSTTEGTNPLFKWINPAPADGALIQICSDSFCTHVVTQFALAGTSGRPPSGMGLTHEGLYYWRAAAVQAGMPSPAYSYVWEFVLGSIVGTTSGSWGSNFDMNLDGLSEIAASTDNGRTDVYLGRPTAPSVFASSFQTPVSGTGRFGSLRSAGDVNGDGYCDLVIASVTEVLVLYGGATGMSMTMPSSVIPPVPGDTAYGNVAAGIGDFDGDGYGDIAVADSAGTTVYLFRGSANGATTMPAGRFAPVSALAGFGSDVAGGDLNGDGYSDLVVTAPGNNAIAVFAGPSYTTAPFYVSPPFTAGIGNRVRVVGDLNDDGFPDVVSATTTAGELAMFFSNASFGFSKATYAVGSSMAGAFDAIGDSNGDGYADFAVATTPSSGVQVVLGNNSNAGPGPLIAPPPGFVNFGADVSGGDINGDGMGDVIVGDPGTGEVSVYAGSMSGFTLWGTTSPVVAEGAYVLASLDPFGRRGAVMFGKLRQTGSQRTSRTQH